MSTHWSAARPSWDAVQQRVRLGQQVKAPCASWQDCSGVSHAGLLLEEDTPLLLLESDDDAWVDEEATLTPLVAREDEPPDNEAALLLDVPTDEPCVLVLAWLVLPSWELELPAPDDEELLLLLLPLPGPHPTAVTNATATSHERCMPII